MKHLKPSDNPERWPRCAVRSVETRKRDLVVRITDWMSDKDEPAYDVEVYVGGVYDFNLSKSFTMHSLKNRAACKAQAIAFAQAQIAALL